MGFVAGTSLGYQATAQRFMGLDPNEREVQKYGVATEERMRKFNILAENPMLEMIDSDLVIDSKTGKRFE